MHWAAPTQLNAKETDQFTEMMSQLREDEKADTALVWRERYVNEVQANSPTVLGTTFQLATALAVTGVVAHRDGNREAERVAAIERWRAEAPELGIDVERHPTPFQTVVAPDGTVLHAAQADPRYVLGVIPRTLVAPGAMLLTSMLLAAVQRGRALQPYLQYSIVGTLGYTLASTIHNAAYRDAREQPKTTNNNAPQVAAAA